MTCPPHERIVPLMRDADRPGNPPRHVGGVCLGCAMLTDPRGRPIRRDTKAGARVVEAAVELAETSVATWDELERPARRRLESIRRGLRRERRRR